MKSRHLVFLLGALVMAVLSACGSAAATLPTGPIDVPMTLSEFKIASPTTTFKVGTPYRFVVTNTGQAQHDFMIMPQGSLDEKQALLKVEDTDLKPGATVNSAYTFTKAGAYEVACHVQGHYESGMKLSIIVE